MIGTTVTLAVACGGGILSFTSPAPRWSGDTTLPDAPIFLDEASEFDAPVRRSHRCRCLDGASSSCTGQSDRERALAKGPAFTRQRVLWVPLRHYGAACRGSRHGNCGTETTRLDVDFALGTCGLDRVIHKPRE
jgi:hypothetical protein